MYKFTKNNVVINSYIDIDRLYKNELFIIAANFNFDLFNKILKDLKIFDYCDNENLKIGAIRNGKICDDEIKLMSNSEKYHILNACLENGYRILKY